MTIRPQSRRLLVCVISEHPGLLITIGRLLANPEFSVIKVRWSPKQQRILPQRAERSPTEKQFPNASVFVLDGNSLDFEAELWAESLRVQHPGAKLLIVKETAKDELVFPLLRMGAKGIVRYSEAERDLANAVRAVASGDFWVDRKQMVRFVDWLLSTLPYRRSLCNSGQLSRREREILTSVSRGLTNKEIASAFDISERTVKFHVSHLLEKLGARRRAELIARQYQASPDCRQP